MSYKKVHALPKGTCPTNRITALDWTELRLHLPGRLSSRRLWRYFNGRLHPVLIFAALELFTLTGTVMPWGLLATFPAILTATAYKSLMYTLIYTPSSEIMAFKLPFVSEINNIQLGMLNTIKS